MDRNYVYAIGGPGGYGTLDPPLRGCSTGRDSDRVRLFRGEESGCLAPL
jgi:hypothetical protein